MKNERRKFSNLCALLAVALSLLFTLSITVGGRTALADDLPQEEATPWAEPTPIAIASPTFIAIVELPTNTPLPVLSTPTLPPEPAPSTPTEFVAPATTEIATIAVPTVAVGIIPLPTPQEPSPLYLPESSPTSTISVVAEPTSIPTPIPTSTPIPNSPTPTATSKAGPSWFPPGPECASKPGKILLKLDVPYIHQVNDVTGADGNWACGPTSVLMTLAYYGKVEPWPQYQQAQSGKITPKPAKTTKATATLTRTATRTATITPTPKRPQPTKAAQSQLNAKLDYGPYLTEPFTYGGHTFSATGPDPRGNLVAGLYGSIVPTGLADWGRMSQVFAWYGLTTRQLAPSWDSVVAALKRGHPVLLGNDLTAAGHILVAVGYTANNNLIVNDPYGNRFTSGYGANDGEGVYYPWSCSRVRNALEVVGVYTPPATSTHTPQPTAVTVAEALPERGAAPDSVQGPASTETPQNTESRNNNRLLSAAQAIGPGAPLPFRRITPTRDHSAASRQAAHANLASKVSPPQSRVLLADRTSQASAYWWFTLPTLLALTGFVVFISQWRARKRPHQAKPRVRSLPDC